MHRRPIADRGERFFRRGVERIDAELVEGLDDLRLAGDRQKHFGEALNAAPGFDRMPQVIDGASDFFYELLGPKMGQHARTAVGLAELPHGIPVEINGEFEIHT